MTTLSDLEIFDRPDFLARLGDDEELLREVVELFLEDAPQQLESIARAVAAGNAADIAPSAHQLKGAAANISARRAAEAASRLETAAKSGDSIVAGQEFAKLKNEMQQLLVHLKA